MSSSCLAVKPTVIARLSVLWLPDRTVRRDGRNPGMLAQEASPPPRGIQVFEKGIPARVAHFIPSLKWFVLGLVLAFLTGLATWSNYDCFYPHVRRPDATNKTR